MNKGVAMKLSDGEKLILIMLSEIYEHLQIKSAIDPTFVQDAIHTGNIWGLDWEYIGIFHGTDHDDPPALHETVEIMGMWDNIEFAYEQLSDGDKERVKKEAEPFGEHARFRGFDGNNETEHLSIARFLIDKLDRFSRFKGRSLNSHAPSLDTYNRMLSAYKEVVRSDPMPPLSASQLIQILNEQVHPSNR